MLKRGSHWLEPPKQLQEFEATDNALGKKARMILAMVNSKGGVNSDGIPLTPAPFRAVSPATSIG
jgi:hypothetical protein